MSLFHPVHKCTFIYCTANALRVLLMKFTMEINDARFSTCTSTNPDAGTHDMS